MRQKQPPALAAWMLERFVARRNDALTGDLLEAFRSGRSAGWYWRQVLVAIAFGFSQELRTHWMALLFAGLWTVPVPVFELHVVRRVAESVFFSQRWQLSWPYSTICELGLIHGCYLLYIWSGVAGGFLVSLFDDAQPKSAKACTELVDQLARVHGCIFRISCSVFDVAPASARRRCAPHDCSWSHHQLPACPPALFTHFAGVFMEPPSVYPEPNSQGHVVFCNAGSPREKV